MEPVELLDISREAIWVMIKISTPLLLVALSIGLIISLFQALTQIQEATLSFVPKMLAIFLGLILFMPFMLGTLKDFTEELAHYIITMQ